MLLLPICPTPPLHNILLNLYAVTSTQGELHLSTGEGQQPQAAVTSLPPSGKWFSAA